MGTSIEIKLTDCEEFKKNHPKLMEVCGWDSCPKDNVRIWVGGFKDEGSVVQILRNNGSCFEEMIMNLNSLKGAKYQLIGMDDGEDELVRNCGKDSINDLSSQSLLNKMCTIGGFKKLTLFLESLGYRIGLTYTVAPYDWRVSMKNSNTT